ncbi:MAG: U32 family peptidase [Bacteroidales bacterium]|nr:U32 family peptidase [Bacteroidales bacterium]
MKDLELLAPARNADIGIAAIDCGADAVYIAGPEFGARKAAGNSMEDIRRLCGYAHRFGVRIFLTLNTILYDNELEPARKLLKEAEEAGVDAIIAQDPAVWKMTSLPVHASTQCAIRTPEAARFYEDLGSSRLVLERQLSLEQIRDIRKATSCELEFFVHGALCVCYSGQCYMSERIDRRSANRGECIQACRSLYDLVDGSGKVLVKDKALLSLKDYNLRSRLEDLADEGICSFKIEGRLKSISYVRNVVRAYSIALDNLVAKYPGYYRRTSFGRSGGGFTPDLDKTFNRTYTKLFIDGSRGRWSSMDAPKSMGEEVGTVVSVNRAPGRLGDDAGRMEVIIKSDNPSLYLRNGDGFSFISKDHNEIVGFRGDVCRGIRIACRNVPELYVGARLYRNLDSAFGKELETNLPVRLIPVSVEVSILSREGSFIMEVVALSQDGREVRLERDAGPVLAVNPSRMKEVFISQFGKATGSYSFSLDALHADSLGGRMPFLPVSAINGIRRECAAALDGMPLNAIPLYSAVRQDRVPATEGQVTYKSNVANMVTERIYREGGAEGIERAYEITHRKGVELMRTKYCIRYELGMCPVHQKGTPPERLYLLNNGKRYTLGFDCAACEMTLTD